MNTSIFKITDVPANSNGVNWSVTWPGRGVVKAPDKFLILWEHAVKACAVQLALAFQNGEIYVINNAWAMSSEAVHVYQTVSNLGGVVGVGFQSRAESEKFVDSMEKFITWRILSKDSDYFRQD